MTIEPRTITHERFKELVREWLDTHTEEYYAFATEMNRRDRTGFEQIFQYALTLAPSYAKAVVSRMTDSRSEDFFSLERTLEEADIANKIVKDFQLQYPGSITPPLLAWLYFGNSWETIVAYNEEMIQDKSTGMMSKLMARLIIKFTIKQSIKIEHRTKDDWNNFRNMQKELGSVVNITDVTLAEMEETETLDSPLEKPEQKKRGRKRVRDTFDTLLLSNHDEIKKRICQYVYMDPSGTSLATLYLCLVGESHMKHCDITTFHHALKTHMPDHKFVDVRMVQSAHKQITTPMMAGKRLIDFGEDKSRLENAKKHFAA